MSLQNTEKWVTMRTSWTSNQILLFQKYDAIYNSNTTVENVFPSIDTIYPLQITFSNLQNNDLVSFLI